MGCIHKCTTKHETCQTRDASIPTRIHACTYTYIQTKKCLNIHTTYIYIHTLHIHTYRVYIHTYRQRNASISTYTYTHTYRVMELNKHMYTSMCRDDIHYKWLCTCLNTDNYIYVPDVLCSASWKSLFQELYPLRSIFGVGVETDQHKIIVAGGKDGQNDDDVGTTTPQTDHTQQEQITTDANHEQQLEIDQKDDSITGQYGGKKSAPNEFQILVCARMRPERPKKPDSDSDKRRDGQTDTNKNDKTSENIEQCANDDANERTENACERDENDVSDSESVDYHANTESNGVVEDNYTEEDMAESESMYTGMALPLHQKLTLIKQSHKCSSYEAKKILWASYGGANDPCIQAEVCVYVVHKEYTYVCVCIH
jgi:hypothetical protein